MFLQRASLDIPCIGYGAKVQDEFDLNSTDDVTMDIMTVEDTLNWRLAVNLDEQSVLLAVAPKKTGHHPKARAWRSPFLNFVHLMSS